MTDNVNRIAYVNLNGELETISPQGEDRHTITQGDHFFQFPAWSPDGARIAAVGSTRERSGVFVFADDESGIVRNTDPRSIYESDDDAPIYLYWSPDNQHLSFITIRPHEQNMGLHVVSVDEPATNMHEAPVAIGRPCFWDWSSDGKRILLHTGMATEESAQLAYIDPFNPKSGRASIARPGLFQAPGIARSGRYFAFTQVNREGELQLVVDGRATNNQLLVAHHGIAALSWSPTNDQLAFISPTEPVRTYYGPLKLLDPTRGSVRELTDDIVLAFFWSPDGKRIAYFTVANIADQIWSSVLPNPEASAMDGGFYNDDEIEAPQGVPFASTDVSEFSSDDVDSAGLESEGFSDSAGSYVEEERVLRLNLWCVDIDTDAHRLIRTFEPVDMFVNQFLPFFDQYALSHRVWSPDSTHMVLPVVDYDDEGNDVPRIMVVPMLPRGGKPYAVADGVMAFWSQQ